MTHLFGFILEDLEAHAGDYAAPPCQEAVADPDAWFQQAKEELRTAWTRGTGIAEATDQFLAARNAVAYLLESIWPDRDEPYAAPPPSSWAFATQQEHA